MGKEKKKVSWRHLQFPVDHLSLRVEIIPGRQPGAFLCAALSPRSLCVWNKRGSPLCPRISSAESHSQQQWHANPRALNGLTCVALTIHGGKARRDQRGCEPVSPETRERTAAELIWITFLAEILKRAFRQSSSPSRTVSAQSRRTRSRVPRRQRLRQTAPQ